MAAILRVHQKPDRPRPAPKVMDGMMALTGGCFRHRSVSGRR